MGQVQLTFDSRGPAFWSPRTMLRYDEEDTGEFFDVDCDERGQDPCNFYEVLTRAGLIPGDKCPLPGTHVTLNIELVKGEFKYDEDSERS